MLRRLERDLAGRPSWTDHPETGLYLLDELLELLFGWLHASPSPLTFKATKRHGFTTNTRIFTRRILRPPQGDGL